MAARYVTNLTHAGFEPRYSPYYIRTIRQTKEAHPMHTISRAALIQAVEAGIATARTLQPYQKARLRLVAIVADEVAVGDFYRYGVGCPIQQAGMGTGSEFEHELAYGGQDGTGLVGFYRGFDRTVRAATGALGALIVSVVE